MRSRTVLPDLISIVGLFLGFWAILLISQGRIVTACWMIVIAAIMDGLDGTIARLIRGTSVFGTEVDSLADIVSFGVAPAVLIYAAVLEPYGILGVMFAFLPLLGGMLRLARFNVMATSGAPRSKWFVGMPIPTSALLLAGFYLYMHGHTEVDADARIWFSLNLAVSLLMVSPIPYRKLPGTITKRDKRTWIPAIIVILAASAMIWNPDFALFPMMLIYMLSGPVEWAIEHLRKGKLISGDADSAETATTAPRRRAAKRPRRSER